MAPLKAGPFEFDPPKWAISILAIIVLVGAGAWVYFSLVAPHLAADNVAKNIQLQHGFKHVGEVASFSQEWKDARGEKVKLSYYTSDGCVMIERWPADPLALFSRSFILDATTLPDSAKQVPASFSSSTVPLSFLGIEGIASAQSRCYPTPLQHPGTYQWQVVDVQGCWQKIVQWWPDSCSGWFARNTCFGTESGFTWTHCVH